jgi:hypothetical protein
VEAAGSGRLQDLVVYAMGLSQPWKGARGREEANIFTVKAFF